MFVLTEEWNKRADTELATLRAENEKLRRALEGGQVTALGGLARLRGNGWMVAVHNDYRLNGETFTFWLFTHPDGRWIKGEGRTDEQALEQANAALTAAPAAPEQEKPMDEFAWVIEAAGPRYWNGHGILMENFTEDHSKAIRFARREDAEVVIHWLLQSVSGFLVSREHAWMSPRPPAAPQEKQG